MNAQPNRPSLPPYVLVTPARNEERYLGQTVQAVLAQTVRPLRWVIVSDGSTDRTDEIASQTVAQHPWVHLVRMPEHRDRHFAAKVACFNAGVDALSDLPYAVIGNLDADITFEPDYFDFLLKKFADDERLGVAGTPFTESGSTYDYRFASSEHVSGACQLFRRACFEEIGGYIPIKGGAIDWTAVTTARMNGWRTRTFTEKTCLHHRSIGTGGGGGHLSAQFRQGRKDYYVGGHPLWQGARAVFQMRNRPLVLGGSALWAGYIWAWLTRTRSPVPVEVRMFHRKEQMARLRTLCREQLRRPAHRATVKPAPCVNPDAARRKDPTP